MASTKGVQSVIFCMEHTRQWDSIQLDSCVLTIGSFDGVHLGHKALVERAVKHAKRYKIPSVVLTFFPHPSVILRDRQPAFYISSPDEKAKLLGNLGVDQVITQKFSKELSSMRASDFLDELQSHLNPRVICIGEDFTFGYQREGSRRFLEKSGALRGFQVEVQPPILVGGEVVSSTRVREALRAGDVTRVETYLGRPFIIPGRVIRGANRGKSIGFPTANLQLWEERAYPRRGVYACLARLDEKEWLSVTNIGVRPTFDDDHNAPVVEAHLLDFDGDLYGKEIELAFITRLRDEQRFSSVDALKAQITRDVDKSRTILQERVRGNDE